MSAHEELIAAIKAVQRAQLDRAKRIRVSRARLEHLRTLIVAHEDATPHWARAGTIGPPFGGIPVVLDESLEGMDWEVDR